jgi:DNA-binding NarL/FixJ family response regulator
MNGSYDDGCAGVHDAPTRIRVALLNDYEVIVAGLAAMLEPYRDRIAVVDLATGGPPHRPADIALFDTFGGRRHVLGRARQMVVDDLVQHVVLYTWDATEEFLTVAHHMGVSGVLFKSATAEELVRGLERVCGGEQPGFDMPQRGGRQAATPELTSREAEVVALLSLGLSNDEIGKELFLGVETVRTYVRQIYRKLGVRNRTQAALRAVELGLDPPPTRHQDAAAS